MSVAAFSVHLHKLAVMISSNSLWIFTFGEALLMEANKPDIDRFLSNGLTK
jgi:hypothetical protein